MEAELDIHAVVAQIDKLETELRDRLAKINEYGKKDAKAETDYKAERAKNLVSLSAGRKFVNEDSTVIEGKTSLKERSDGIDAQRKLLCGHLESANNLKGLYVQIGAVITLISTKKQIYKHLEVT